MCESGGTVIEETMVSLWRAKAVVRERAAALYRRRENFALYHTKPSSNSAPTARNHCHLLTQRPSQPCQSPSHGESLTSPFYTLTKISISLPF